MSLPFCLFDVWDNVQRALELEANKHHGRGDYATFSTVCRHALSDMLFFPFKGHPAAAQSELLNYDFTHDMASHCACSAMQNRQQILQSTQTISIMMHVDRESASQWWPIRTLSTVAAAVPTDRLH